MMGRRSFIAGSLAAAGSVLLPGGKGGFMNLAYAKSADGFVNLILFDDAGKKLAAARVAKVVKSDAEWRAQLTPLQFQVARAARHRAGLHRRHLQSARPRSVPLHLLPQRFVQLGHKIRFRNRLAEFLGADCPAERQNLERQYVRDDAQRSIVRAVRCTPGTRFR